MKLKMLIKSIKEKLKETREMLTSALRESIKDLGLRIIVKNILLGE